VIKHFNTGYCIIHVLITATHCLQVISINVVWFISNIFPYSFCFSIGCTATRLLNTSVTECAENKWISRHVLQ